MINVSWSLQRAHHGEQPFWMAMTLAGMLGQIGLPGGGFGFGYGAVDGMGRPRIPVRTPTFAAPQPGQDRTSRSRASPTCCSSPARPSTSTASGSPTRCPHGVVGGRQSVPPPPGPEPLRRAWARPETVIVNEPWWTHGRAPRRHRAAGDDHPRAQRYRRRDARPLLSPCRRRSIRSAQARDDYDIFADLAERLGFRDRYTEGRSETEWLRHMYDVAASRRRRAGLEMPDFETLWEVGHVEFPEPNEPYVMFGDFRADPAKAPLKTPSGRIEIFSEAIDLSAYDDCAGHAKWYEPAEWLGAPTAKLWPLHLISNQPRTRLHSQTDNGSVSRAAKIKGREAMWINPRDAAARAIKDGDVVRVFNDRGACLAGAVVTDQVRPGVVQLATGAWYDPVDGGATLEAHGNPNVLTADIGSSKLAQAPIAQTALVEVERHSGALPEIMVFSEPAVA